MCAFKALFQKQPSTVEQSNKKYYYSKTNAASNVCQWFSICCSFIDDGYYGDIAVINAMTYESAKRFKIEDYTDDYSSFSDSNSFSNSSSDWSWLFSL